MPSHVSRHLIPPGSITIRFHVAGPTFQAGGRIQSQCCLCLRFPSGPLPLFFSMNTLVVGQNLELNLTTFLQNGGEESYSTNLTFVYPSGLAYQRFRVMQVGSGQSERTWKGQRASLGLGSLFLWPTFNSLVLRCSDQQDIREH